MNEATPSQGGYSVPNGVAGRWIDQLRNESVFLAAPGIRLIEFESATFRIPAVQASSKMSVVAEGTTIPKCDMTFGALDFSPIKFGSIYQATSELLEDSALSVEAVVAQTMVEQVASDVDLSAFQGTGDANSLAGIAQVVANSTGTALPSGSTQITYDNVLDAYMAIVSTGRKPTVIWCSPDMYKGLLKSRENTGGAPRPVGRLSGSRRRPAFRRSWLRPAERSHKLLLITAGFCPGRLLFHV